MKIKFSTEMSINAGQALVIGTVRVDDQEYSATYEIAADGSCDLSSNPSDTDDLPDDAPWPIPPRRFIREAARLARGWDGIA